MRLFVIYVILIGLLLGCALPQGAGGMKRRDLREYYSGSGVVRYFLPDLPTWANFSQTASCSRNSTVRFINFFELRNSLSMNYTQAVHFQHMFNVGNKRMKRRYKVNYIPFEEEEKLFHNISDKVQTGITEFLPPKYKRVNIVWVDPFVNKKRPVSDLKKLLNGSVLKTGHPVFVSLCLDQIGLERFVKESGFGNENIKLIPFEMFSVFDETNNQQKIFTLNFEKILKKKELHLFMPRKQVPREFKGSFTKHKY